jgi:hypothetical protein
MENPGASYWGNYSFSLSLYNAAASGHIFVAVAGNEGYDNGSTPFHPA